MASHLKALPVTLLLLVIAMVGCHAKGSHQANRPMGKKAIHLAIARQSHPIAPPKHRKPFSPGPWKKAHATFYQGTSTDFGGACGYKDVESGGYGLSTTALSAVLFKDGQACGSCYEIKCMDSPQWCKPGQPSLIVTATNLCPPNWALSSDNGGWCNSPREHFDIAEPVFTNIAEYKAGIVPVQYRRVPCNKQGGIRFTMSGHYYFSQVLVWNVGGAGDVVSVQVKGGDPQLPWTPMQRDWGSVWKTSAILAGESLSFRVGTSDGRFSTSWHIFPKNWQYGQTYVGKNFR